MLSYQTYIMKKQMNDMTSYYYFFVFILFIVFHFVL